MIKTKVLFVDDDITFGSIVMITLEDLGYEAYYQSSLAAINEIIYDIKPDIIILDVEIGKSNSVELFPGMREAVGDIPVIFVSSHTDSSIIAKAIDMGAVAYLKKPFNNEELIAYINRHVRKTESHDLKFGKFSLKTNDESMYCGETLVKQLSPIEFRLLKTLVYNIDAIVKRDTIINKVWNGEDVSTHSLANFIAKIRSYISDDNDLELITVPRVGYKLSLRVK